MRSVVLVFIFLQRFLLSTFSFQTLTPRPQFHRMNHLMSIVENIITKDQFTQIVASNAGSGKPAVVDFQKSQCKPCIRIAPEFDALAVKYDSQVNFYKVDADTSKEALLLLKQEGVRSVPTFQVYFGGEKVDRVQGAHIDELEAILTGILNSKK